jgi:hypothetical protein
MHFTYDTHAEDVAEATCAIFLRSPGSKKIRIRNAFLSLAIGLGAAYFVLRERSSPYSLYIAAAASIGAALFSFATYESGIRRRILRYCKDDLKGERPLSTYTLSEKSLKFECRSTSIEFQFSALKAVHDRGQRLEIDFGESGLCLIPKRAFPDKKFEAEFKENITRKLK